MQLFAGSSETFLGDAAQKQIAEKLGDSFYDYSLFCASNSKFNSWKNSLVALANSYVIRAFAIMAWCSKCSCR